MSAALRCPANFTLVFHNSLSDSYELSKVLLATADFDGTLQLLTSGWERVLGYGREELEGKTLADLLWSDRRGAARTVAAILDPPRHGARPLIAIRRRARRAKRAAGPIRA